ncbi:sensor histidine kinase [Flavitalea sp.]|nr:PAS domain S-box protein [Flavitalea sp.]
MIRNYITNFIVVVVITVGIIAIGGWFSDLGKMRPLVSSIASTKFNTAICLIFSAIALFVSNRQKKSKYVSIAGIACAYAVVVIASLTILEYITGIKVGIDQVIVNDLGGDANPGRIELSACLMFLIVGVMLIKLERSTSHILVQILLPLVFFVAVFITFNFISGLNYLESMPFAVNTALTTSLSIMALCIGIFYSSPLDYIKFSFEKKMAAYFAVTILLLGIVFFSFSANNQKLIASSKLIDHTKDVLLRASLVLNEAQDIENGARGFLITGREEFLEPYYKSSVSIFKNIGEVKRLTEGNANQQRRVDTLLSLATQNILLRKNLIDFKRGGFTQPLFATMLIGAEKKLMDRLRQSVADIQHAEETSLKQHNLENAETAQGSQRTIAILQILVFLTLIAMFVIIYRNTMSRNKAEAALRKSEHFIRSVIDNAASSISIRDLNGRYLLVNKEGQKLLNRSEQEILGKTPYDFFPKELADNIRAPEEEVIKEGKLTAKEIQRPGEHGLVYHLVVRFPLFDDNQQIYALCSMSTDITAIKQAQAVLEQAHKQQQIILDGIQDLMEASLDIICLLDEQGRFVQISANCERLLGYTPDELAGRYYSELLVPEEKPASVEREAMIKDGATIRDSENRYVRKDGKIISLLATAIWSPENHTFFSILKDATEKQMTARQLTELNENLKKRAAELQASNIELERFAYVASHDLQEPLRMVSSFLQLLEKKLGGNLDDTSKKYIYFAIDGAERMKTLIQDLLQYSRIGTSKELVVSVDCNEIMNSVKNIYTLAIRETKADLIVHPMPVIKAEKGQIHQLFQNLVGNAIKYSSPEPPRIEVGYEEQAEHWQFYVKDHGIGINQKFYDKIFVIFQRLHNKSEYTGTGIGLAICKKIVERHGGTIWVESEQCKGSTFFIRLPKF